MSRFGIAIILTIGMAILVATPVAAQFNQGVEAMRASDYPTAMAAWQKAAEAGDARAAYGIGYLYQFGLGVAADDGKARGWYDEAAAKNNADALYALGRMDEGGKAGPRDLAKALQEYRRAAESGLPDAEFAVGRMIMRGRVPKGDPAEAIDWLNKAALQDHPGADYLLGEAYETGWGVPADKITAYVWYARAKAGDPAWLRDTDLEFSPAVALATLRSGMSAREIGIAEARLRQPFPPLVPQVRQSAVSGGTTGAP